MQYVSVHLSGFQERFTSVSFLLTRSVSYAVGRPINIKEIWLILNTTSQLIDVRLAVLIPLYVSPQADACHAHVCPSIFVEPTDVSNDAASLKRHAPWQADRSVSIVTVTSPAAVERSAVRICRTLMGFRYVGGTTEGVMIVRLMLPPTNCTRPGPSLYAVPRTCLCEAVM